jgi:peptidoglycan/LPS O-acetylase OafA/YrhL
MDKWPFAHWAAWLCGAVVAEVYAGVVKLPRWCSSLWALGLFLLAGLLLNSQTLGRLAGSRFAAATLSASPAACFAMQCLYEFSDLLFAFGFLILLNRWVSADRNGRPLSGPVRWLQWIGIFSYSLYLVHLPLIHVSETIFVHLGMGNRFWENGLRYAVMLPLSLLCGWLFFMLVERWFLGRPQARQAGSVSPQLERTGG